MQNYSIISTQNPAYYEENVVKSDAGKDDKYLM